VDPDDSIAGPDTYMTADYTVSCNSSEYRFGFIWACVMVLVYPIGCPAYYFYLLHGVRHEIQARVDHTTTFESTDSVLESIDESNTFPTVSNETRAREEKLRSLRFLYESYHPHYWWWEIAETSQRLLLTGILVLIAQGSAIQIIVGALLTLTFLYLYARYEPFTDPFVLSIKIVSYWQIFFVFWIALLIKADFPSVSLHSLGICLVFTIFANVLNDLWKMCVTTYTATYLESQTQQQPPSEKGSVTRSSPFHLEGGGPGVGTGIGERSSAASDHFSQTELGRISSKDRSSLSLASH
jgi:hypothetical protein